MLTPSQCYVGRPVAYVPYSHFSFAVKYGRIYAVTPSGRITLRVTRVDGKAVKPFLVTVKPDNVHDAPCAVGRVAQTVLPI